MITKCAFLGEITENGDETYEFFSYFLDIFSLVGYNKKRFMKKV